MNDFVCQKIKLPRALPPVLGVGAYLKNSICLIQGDEAWFSRDHGSLEEAGSVMAFRETVEAFLEMAKEKPLAVAHDFHPDFYPTIWAGESGYRCFAIQHHHAHIAAVMAEYHLDEPVLGVALDGFGLGERNESWGGEFLLVDAHRYKRLAYLKPMHQPGGDAAASEPWRMGAAALWELGRGDEIKERYKDFEGAQHLKQMMDKNVNAPMTSSCGRLFDAACGLLNIKPEETFDGEAPMELERLASEVWDSNRFATHDSENWRIDSRLDSPEPAYVLNMDACLEKLSHMSPQEGAVFFHKNLISGVSTMIEKLAQEHGDKDICMAGGCFFNKLLRGELTSSMIKRGLRPRLSEVLSAGDQALALGQAYAAALLLEKERK